MRPLHQQVENLGKEVTSQMNEKGNTMWKSTKFTLSIFIRRKEIESFNAKVNGVYVMYCVRKYLAN